MVVETESNPVNPFSSIIRSFAEKVVGVLLPFLLNFGPRIILASPIYIPRHRV